MEEKKNPVINKQELSDESLEQVTGGCEPKDRGDTHKKNDEIATDWVVPSGIVDGAKILIGGAWDVMDREKPPLAPPTPSAPSAPPIPTPGRPMR